MRLSDGLRAKIADLCDRMESMSKRAADEGRLFDDVEAQTWDSAEREVKALRTQLERQLASEELARGGGGGQRVAIDDQGQRHLILKAADKLTDRYPPRHGQPLSLGKTIRGLLTGRWENAEPERRAMGEGGAGSAGGFLLTPELSSQWYDLARARSTAVAAGVGVIDMPTQILRLATIEEDPVPVFRPENVSLPEDDVTFGSVELRARLVGVLCRASLELIMDAANAADMIEASIAGALAVAMDGATFAGDGVVSAAVDNPRGILNTPINEVPLVGAPTNFDPWLDAIAMIEAYNLLPNAVVDGVGTVSALRKLKTGLAGDMTSLIAPPAYTDLDRFVTTGMPAGTSLVGQFNQAVIGLRMPITLEATRTGGNDTFRNVQVLFRGIARMDVGVIRTKAFTKLTGITAAALATQPQAQAERRAAPAR